MFGWNSIFNSGGAIHMHRSPQNSLSRALTMRRQAIIERKFTVIVVVCLLGNVTVYYLEAISSKLLIVDPESDPQTRTSCLPPDIKADKHSVAFCSYQVNRNI